ncbi:DUF6049 family protein [Jatrophihabitans sp.]|uniref:DUF6049 family protein n=1 Tax=Jatrophihabitans sp. TaxID=1932789 RepID=UPI0030C7185D|nr:hypothetical protein [Jatrophihabitans sp.]
MRPAAPCPRAPRGGRLAALVLAVLIVVLSVPFAAGAATTPKSGDVTLTILDVTPTSPLPSSAKERLTVTFRLRNNTSQNFPHLSITGQRGTPIFTQPELDSAFARPTAPDPQDEPATNPPPLVVSLPAGQVQDDVFTTTTGIPTDSGICLCADAIYPLYFSATVDRGGRTVTLGTAQTYIPAFKTQAADITPVQVGWVWPLLDRPHRLTSSTLFLDDDLAAEVAPGGRLDRALTVLENVAGSVPMTVITDPNLLDELQVMASGSYQVQQGKGTVPGTGTADAATWLARLRDVLQDDPDTEIDLTPYGDPDVEALQHTGLTWTSTLTTAVQQHLVTALGGIDPATDIEWPLDQTVSSDTLATLVGKGIQTVIVTDKTLPGGSTETPPPDALAALRTSAGNALAGVTSTTIQSWVAKVVTAGGAGVAALPELVAQVAQRAEETAAEKSDHSPYVLITPPRDLDVDPMAATRAILETADTFWSKPLSLHKATQTIAAVSHGSLTPQRTAGFPEGANEALHFVAHSLPGLKTLFTDVDAASQIGSLPEAAQLAASSSLLADPDLAISYAVQLRDQVRVLRSGVYLHTPASLSGSYTLTSNNSPLPITIVNALPVPVKVDVDASAIGGLPGFTATPVRGRSIPAKTTVQIKIPTHFDRAGRIEVAVSLSTPSGLPLGRPINLSVRSTALGTIGVVITAVAAVVLVVALLVRIIARVRRHGRAKVAAS